MSWIKEEFNFNDLQRLLFRLTEQVKAFQGLTPAELTELLSHAEKCSYAQDAIIVKEGSVGTHMYIIIHGDAVVSKQGTDGEVELARLTVADSFGEMALADHEARSATVKALSPCILVRISDQALSRKPEIAMKFYRNVARVLTQRLRNANELLAWQL